MFLIIPFLTLSVSLRRVHWEDLPSYEFEEFVQDFNKSYSESELDEARLAFYHNRARLIEKNKDESLTYKVTASEHTDNMEPVYPGSPNNHPLPDASSHFFNSLNFMKSAIKSYNTENLPKEVDYSKNGYSTPVKNQGKCGSCWAFTATEVLETYMKINSNVLKELSPEQISRCAVNAFNCGGTGGCDGGVVQMAFTYAQFFGLTTAETLPYSQSNGDCTFKANTMPSALSVRGFERLPRNDPDIVKWHLANVGPLAVSVFANPDWFNYHSGVFNGCSYDENIAQNHAVTLVGYGTDEQFGDYWKIRNHWGEEWGEEGFIRLAREPTLKCGWDNTPATGSACQNDGQTKQYVCGQCAVLYESVYPIGVTAI